MGSYKLTVAQYVFTMNQVAKLVPPKRYILRDISLSFFPGAKIGVLGLNGAGKSTLPRIIAGVATEFDGEARPQPGIRIGYLQQELDPNAPPQRQFLGRNNFARPNSPLVVATALTAQ